MEKSNKANKTGSSESSLGILNMDNLKGFGENSSLHSIQGQRHSVFEQRLKAEREKVLDMFSIFKKPKNINTVSPKPSRETSKLNSTEYSRPYSQSRTEINISDLIKDETIPLESTNECTPSSLSSVKNIKISFEPTEITGRSTLYNKDTRTLSVCSSNRLGGSRLSVDEILASSFAPKARNLCGSLGNGHKRVKNFIKGTSCSSSESLPRTADMSSLPKLSTGGDTIDDDEDGLAMSFTKELSNAIPQSDLQSEIFESAEMMKSKLLDDERSWANQFAVVPTEYTSVGGQQMDGKLSFMQTITSPNTPKFGDANFSVGRFFNTRSDEIFNIVSLQSPVKLRRPVALIEDSDATISISPKTSTTTDTETTPKIDNKTYNKLMTIDTVSKIKRPTIVNGQTIHERTDTGNCTKHSDALSITALENALRQINFANDTAFADTAEELFKLLKSKQNNTQPQSKTLTADDNEMVSAAAATHTNLETTAKNEEYEKLDISSENKENIDPRSGDHTLSMTDSLLNLSSDSKNQSKKDMKKNHNLSLTQQRSPLSPIENQENARASKYPILRISDELGTDIEADVDEWPSTPIVGPKRRVQRKKSPNYKSATQTDDTLTIEKQKTPINSATNGKTKQNKTPTPTTTTTTSTDLLSHSDRVFAPERPAFGSNQGADKDLQLNQGLSKSEVATTTTTPTHKPSDISGRLPNSDTTSITTKNITDTATKSNMKSLCSTRLENINSPNASTISTNLFKSSPVNTSGQNLSLNANAGSPTPSSLLDASPISSPIRDCLSSQASSPCGSINSQHHSHRRHHQHQHQNQHRHHSLQINHPNNDAVDTMGCCIHKNATSPSFSVNAGKTGGPPTRAYSYLSLKSCTSRCTSRSSNSSEFSHRDGKTIPIKVTTLELSWGSTKLRSDSRKSMQVKNCASQRLKMRLEISGPGYRIVGIEGGNNTLTLQSQECRTIVISFCPTVIGCAVGILSFYSPNGTITNNAPFLEIPLYGYGGRARVIPQDIFLGPVGPPYLPIGNINHLDWPIEGAFRIHNKGPLLGFALISISMNDLNLPHLSDLFEIQPRQMIIRPGDTVTVNLHFHPRREDMKKIMKKRRNSVTTAVANMHQVFSLAKLHIICGDEANRQRMRRLVQRMTPLEVAKITTTALENLWTTFPEEIEMLELLSIKEKTDVATDLFAYVHVHEIALTLDHNNFNETIEKSSIYFSENDNTVLFQTVCAATSPTSDELAAAAYNNNDDENDDDNCVRRANCGVRIGMPLDAVHEEQERNTEDNCQIGGHQCYGAHQRNDAHQCSNDGENVVSSSSTIVSK